MEASRGPARSARDRFGVGCVSAFSPRAERAWAAAAPDLPETRLPASRPRREWEAPRHLRRDRGNDLIVCGTWYPEGLLAWPARSPVRRARPRVGTDAPARALAAWGLEGASGRVLTGARLVVANSEYTGQLVRECAALQGGRDPAGRRSPPVRARRPRGRSAPGVVGKRVIGTVARLHRYKGHDVVFQGAGRLAPLRPRVVRLPGRRALPRRRAAPRIGDRTGGRRLRPLAGLCRGGGFARVLPGLRPVCPLHSPIRRAIGKPKASAWSSWRPSRAGRRSSAPGAGASPTPSRMATAAG